MVKIVTKVADPDLDPFISATREQNISQNYGKFKQNQTKSQEYHVQKI